MPTQKEELKRLLQRDREVTISVIGRKSGKTISRPVWFVLETDRLHLLPVQGSNTQWYRNLLCNRWIKISTKNAQAEFEGTPITDPNMVSTVVDQFRHKYGAGDVKKYYAKFDVAVLVDLAGESIDKKR